MSINLPSAIAVSLTTKNFSAGTLVSEGLAQHASGTPANIARIVVRYFNISLFRPTSRFRLEARFGADSLQPVVRLHAIVHIRNCSNREMPRVYFSTDKK